jgi:hypothetical protein
VVRPRAGDERHPDAERLRQERPLPELLRQAAQQALRRGLVTQSELADVETALQPFGGLAR